MAKSRLDELLVRRGLAQSRTKAQALIIGGKVWAGTERMAKPGNRVGDDIDLRVEGGPAYVSRGGEKLAGALDHFQIDPADMKVMDAGASTGGFTDCLLQRGAKLVNAIDVGTGQLHWKLRQDPRVWFREKQHILETNPADLPGYPFDLVVVDLSFISLKRVLRHLGSFLRQGGTLIALVKPQFESTPAEASRGKGIIRDPAIHQRVRDEIEAAAIEQLPGATALGWIDSPIAGGDGNREFLAAWRKS